MKNPMENTKVNELYGLVKIGNKSKAYNIGDMNMIPPPLANDVIGDTPILVSWCPLCGSLMAHKRKVDGKTLTFSVIGVRELDGTGIENLHLKDEETGSIWAQAMGTAVEGPKKGKELEQIPIQIFNKEVIKKMGVKVWEPR